MIIFIHLNNVVYLILISQMLEKLKKLIYQFLMEAWVGTN